MSGFSLFLVSSCFLAWDASALCSAYPNLAYPSCPPCVPNPGKISSLPGNFPWSQLTSLKSHSHRETIQFSVWLSISCCLVSSWHMCQGYAKTSTSHTPLLFYTIWTTFRVSPWDTERQWSMGLGVRHLDLWTMMTLGNCTASFHLLLTWRVRLIVLPHHIAVRIEWENVCQVPRTVPCKK